MNGIGQASLRAHAVMVMMVRRRRTRKQNMIQISVKMTSPKQKRQRHPKGSRSLTHNFGSTRGMIFIHIPRLSKRILSRGHHHVKLNPVRLEHLPHYHSQNTNFLITRPRKLLTNNKIDFPATENHSFILKFRDEYLVDESIFTHLKLHNNIQVLT